MKPSNVSLYEDMIHAPDFKEEKRYTLSVEIMTDSYLDGKLVDELSLPERCAIINVHRDGKNLSSIVPSAAWVLTIVFGMRTGVSPKRITTRSFIYEDVLAGYALCAFATIFFRFTSLANQQ